MIICRHNSARIWIKTNFNLLQLFDFPHSHPALIQNDMSLMLSYCSHWTLNRTPCICILLKRYHIIPNYSVTFHPLFLYMKTYVSFRENTISASSCWSFRWYKYVHIVGLRIIHVMNIRMLIICLWCLHFLFFSPKDFSCFGLFIWLNNLLYQWEFDFNIHDE